MMRGGVLLQALAMAMVCGVATTAVAGILAQGEPAMRLTSQLSAPHATEEERDQLRREYRLTQASSEFWAGFDNLNARIHGAGDLLRKLREMVEGVPPAAARQPLLAGLEANAAQTPAQAREPATLASVRQVEARSGNEWLALAAVLGGLTFLLIRRRGAARPQPVAARRTAAVPLPPSAEPAVPPMPAGEGLQRNPHPPVAEAPARPLDPVREEMEHALDLAEVMLSYGRTTAAMQTLKDYLHAYPEASVRPWLKLLDLHRQTGMREDFERAAETVHGHFNIRVPHWDEGVSEMPLRSFFDDEEHAEILGLEQLPHILAKVQATWPDESCLEYLRHLLVDNRGGGRQGFPVSVVSEILLLEDILTGRFAGPASPN